MPAITWVMRLFGAEEQKVQEFIKRVQSAKDDGLVSVEAHDEFAKQDEKLKGGGNGSEVKTTD